MSGQDGQGVSDLWFTGSQSLKTPHGLYVRLSDLIPSGITARLAELAEASESRTRSGIGDPSKVALK